jgi:ATP-dependent RNA helicase DDX46/PRP5
MKNNQTSYWITKILRSKINTIIIFLILGKTCPRPVKAWQQCGVTSKIFDILKANFEKPTPIQAQAIPVIMSGRDMMGIAKTGSGKTLAFLLPLFRHINAQPELEEEDGPIAIIMTPTRELCMQIGKEIKRFQRGKIFILDTI